MSEVLIASSVGETRQANPEAAAPEFAALYQTHGRQIYYLCLRFLGDPTKAEDAAHDVFLKAWRKREQFRAEASWRTWVYRITINHCRNLQQRWAERHLLPTDDTILEASVPDPSTPLRVLEIKELGERIQTTLDRLTPEYRLLLLLVADEDLSYEEIGTLTQQTADAVRGKLHRARKAFVVEFEKTA